MPYSTRTIRLADWTQIRHFTPAEFKAPDKMGYEFMLWLDRVRDKAGVSMTITSSYRSEEYNAQVGGAQDSAHSDVPCEAIDIGRRPTMSDPNWNLARFKIITAALSMGCVRIGIYKNGSLHLDRTEEKRPAPRMWVAVDNPARP
jgi:uncharacterized protein YcbK (DUF882 family)